MSEMITIREHWERPTEAHPGGSYFLRIGERFAEATGRFEGLLDPNAKDLAEFARKVRYQPGSAVFFTFENPPMGTLWWSKPMALVKEGPKAMVLYERR